MGDDFISIDTDSVEITSKKLDQMSQSAHSWTSRYFESQQAAAKNNQGFNSSKALIDFSVILHGQIDGFINQLTHNAEAIMREMANYKTMDAEAAACLRREFKALDDLGKPPLSTNPPRDPVPGGIDSTDQSLR